MTRLSYIFLIIIFPLCLHGQNITLIDLNLRYDNPADGENAWRYRKMTTLEWLKNQEADLYFFQEVLHHQYKDLISSLSDYESYGIGREDGLTKGEYSPIFFKKDRFYVKDTLTIWLSPTPSIPSKGWDAACERIATLVILTDKKDGQTLLCINTHWDHVGRIAQDKSAELILNLLELSPSSFSILGGDFNVTAFHPGIVQLRQKLPLLHENEKRNTYHGFNDTIEYDQGPIDFIMANENLKATNYQYFRHSNEGKLLSDHDAIKVEMIKLIKEYREK